MNKKRHVATMIIENSEGKFLLMLRDNKPTIPWPNLWAFIGGGIERDESPKEAVLRETREELCYKFNESNVRFFKSFRLSEVDYEVFYIKGDFKLEDFNLMEGQEIRFFTIDEIKGETMAGNDKEVILEFFKVFNRP